MPRSISPADSLTPTLVNTPSPSPDASRRSSRSARALAHLRQTLPPRTLTAPLLFISLACGILDATTYADTGSFASNQTGNALILTLLLTSTPLTTTSVSSSAPHILPTAVSLLSFLVFGFVFGHLGHYFGARKRGWWLVTLGVQLGAVAVPAVLMTVGVVRLGDEQKGGAGGGRQGGLGGGRDQWLVLGLLAAGAGAQVGMARTSSNPELPTAMLTSPLIDLLTDPNLFLPLRPLFSPPPSTRPRNIRFLYVLALVGGSFVGAVVHKRAGTEWVFWVSVVLRVVVLGWVGWLPGEEEVGKGLGGGKEVEEGRVIEGSRREKEPEEV